MKLIDVGVTLGILIDNPEGHRREVVSMRYDEGIWVGNHGWRPGDHGSWTHLIISKKYSHVGDTTWTTYYGIVLEADSDRYIEHFDMPTREVGYPTEDEVQGFVNREV